VTIESWRLRALAVVAALMVAATAAIPAAAAKGDLKSDMRKLWEDHITWTRLYIVAATAALPEKDATAQRLLQNQTDIGNAIKPFYGDAAGSKLTDLLKDHITIATELIDAAQRGDENKKDDAGKRWRANGDAIAAFLSGANPKNWPLAESKRMLHAHLDLTTSEVVAHLQKDWTADVAAYDKVHEQILQMADMISSGIKKQFANKVR
jgi:hypothetical protein